MLTQVWAGLAAADARTGAPIVESESSTAIATSRAYRTSPLPSSHRSVASIAL
jgi:hypothetical protein